MKEHVTETCLSFSAIAGSLFSALDRAAARCGARCFCDQGFRERAENALFQLGSALRCTP